MKLDFTTMEKWIDSPISEKQRQLLANYIELMLEKNLECNLTRITEPTELLYKHLLDSMILLRYFSFKQKQSLADIGTGAGFPGMILAILTKMSVSLVETVGKKTAFLQDVKEKLQLKNVIVENGRVEELGKKTLRGQFDFVVSRAFANPLYCLETQLPLTKVGGTTILMQGPSFEMTSAIKNTAKLLGSGTITVENYDLGEFGQRCLVIVKKNQRTPTRFPRHNSIIKKQPLFN
jgi:16S rRNA (guanine527-N7)-methyltransferase